MDQPSPEQSRNVTRRRPRSLLYRSDRGGGNFDFQTVDWLIRSSERPKNLIRTQQHDGLPRNYDVTTAPGRNPDTTAQNVTRN